MEGALLKASLVPLEIMRQAYEGLLIHAELADKGSRLAVSDVGVGAQLLRASILGAAMNVFINSKSMADRQKAEDIEIAARKLIADGAALADRVYSKVEEALV
jgi:formiminotetrahydrofolate cyclodeaminase